MRVVMECDSRKIHRSGCRDLDRSTEDLEAFDANNVGDISEDWYAGQASDNDETGREPHYVDDFIVMPCCDLRKDGE